MLTMGQHCAKCFMMREEGRLWYLVVDSGGNTGFTFELVKYLTKAAAEDSVLSTWVQWGPKAYR